MRDRNLADYSSQFDQLAARLRDEINAVHNQGIGYPGSAALNGTTQLPLGAGTAVNGTGVGRIGAVDANGDIVAGPIALDLSTATTVAEAGPAIHTVLGLTARVAATGRLLRTSTVPEHTAPL